VSSAMTPIFDELPAEIPIFPLSDVVLLPKGLLPLNIFEPRYIAMVNHALKHDRLIGMIQPRQQNIEKTPPPSGLYDIGCAGRITNFSETPDGRYEIMLSGVNRFEIINDTLTPHGFRKAGVTWASFSQDLESDASFQLDRDSLNQLLKRYFVCHQLNACWETIKDTPNHMLITALAMICPFTAEEKQALLEAPTCKDRAECLTTMLEMSVAENGCCEHSSTCC
jgi:Lon protease-like protein